MRVYKILVEESYKLEQGLGDVLNDNYVGRGCDTLIFGVVHAR